MPRTLNGMYLGWLLSAAILSACSNSPTYAQTRSDCDEVTIESAGVYAIRHSKIRGLAVAHELGGVVDYVVIWPSTAGADQQSDIIRIIVMADLKPQGGLDCRVSPGDIPNTVSCAQTVPELKLKAIVKFDAKILPPYEPRMKSVLNYLTKDVFGCKLPFKDRGRGS